MKQIIIILIVVCSLFLVACQQQVVEPEEKGPNILYYNVGPAIASQGKLEGMHNAYALFNAGETGQFKITTICYDETDTVIADYDSAILSLEHEAFETWYALCPAEGVREDLRIEYNVSNS